LQASPLYDQSLKQIQIQKELKLEEALSSGGSLVDYSDFENEKLNMKNMSDSKIIPLIYVSKWNITEMKS
jgi:hypothetical protein